MSTQLQMHIKTVSQPSLPSVEGGLLQRKCACGQHTITGGECAECRAKREGTIQRAAISHALVNSVPPIVHNVLGSPGQSLDTGTRDFMEPRFGYDFSSVRVHTDARAAESAQAVNALAYTVGRDVVFGTEQYAPDTGEGKRLLAHELTHVAQQGLSDPNGYALRIGSTNDVFEHQADGVALNILHGQFARPIVSISQPLVQRDLARPPRGLPSPVKALTPEEIQAAIEFNQSRFSDPYSIRVIRDVVGIAPLPAVVDEELIQAIKQWQAERNMTQDGRVGHLTTRSIFLELVAEGEFRDAIFLLMDSYNLPEKPQLNNVRVGVGANCCFSGITAAAAVTSGGPLCGGGPIKICICRPNIPHNIAGYDHFVRIIGHELTHVPHCAVGPADPHVREFEAFFWEVCAQGRAPRLSAPERVDHARMALDEFNLMPFPLRTPAILDKRDRLNLLIAAGGVGPC